MARKILLADDSVTAQNMGRKILADAGYEVVTVNNGSAALKRVAEVKPDLIVLDVYMPGYSGLEVCARLKEAGETSRIPVLLTVGKLEPFKPEEAKRARADAFIVKPFEASELLSALSKLEDRIVPRPEATKPGRFARAIAAVEEGRYDNAVAADEDSGWKNRISFPAKKKKKGVEDEADVNDPAIYNPVNKDLRTVVERPAEHRPQEGKEPEPRIDLAALAPHGLPKDVTPEEIAALAAAAAQIKGTSAASQGTESRLAEEQATQLAAEPPVIDRQEAKTEEQLEAKKEEAPVAAQPPREAITASQEVEAVAEKKAEEPVEASAEKPSDAAQETTAAGPASPVPDDVMAAITALPPVASVAPDAGSGNGAGTHAAEEEPATMAAAAGAELGATSDRWIAIPVPVLPEEAAISLEEEMQKAYAALAAAEATRTASVPAIPETKIGFVEPAPATEISSAVEAAVAQPPVPVSAPPVAETAESMVAVPSPAADAISATVKEPEAAAVYVKETTPAPAEAETAGAVAGEAAEAAHPAVKEFEKVAASHAEEKIPSSAEPELARLEAVEAAASPALEAPLPVEAKAEPIPVAQVPVAQEAAPEPQAASPQDTLPPAAPEPEAEQKQEEPRFPAEAAVAAPAEISPRAETPETAAPAVASEVAAEPALASQIPPQMAEASAPAEPAAGGTEDMAHKEKEIAATTAAAWASWRRIRESGSPKAKPSAEPAKKEAEEEKPAAQDQGKDEAAMAVAAGAEKAPEEVPAGSGSDSAEIASIVDSVLADLRPKIVEEISRKLGKKKKK